MTDKTQDINQHQNQTNNAKKSCVVGFLLQNEYEKALFEIEKLCVQYPDNTDYLSLKTYCLMALSRIDSNFLEILLERVRDLPVEGLICLAEICLGLEKHEEASNLLDDIFEKDPNNICAFLLKAEILEVQEKHEEYLDLLRLMCARFKNDVRVLCLVGNHAIQIGNIKQAQYVFKKALKYNQCYVIQRAELYRYFLKTNKASDLIPYAKKALEVCPDNVEVMHALAMVYMENKEFDDSDMMFIKISSQFKELPDRFKRQWADVLGEKFEYTQAYDLAKTIPSDYDIADPLYYFLRKMLYAMKRYGNASDVEVRAKAWREEFPNRAWICHYCSALLEERDAQTPPPEYVENFFNVFANDFDEVLLERLEYQGPAFLAKILKDTNIAKKSSFEILDAGCGTGLLASTLKPFSLPNGSLTGVDLSSGMLAKADERGLYDMLERSEIVSYLNVHPEQFDLIACFDVLTYFADLNPVIKGFYNALKKNQILVFCVTKLIEDEKQENTKDHALSVSGQYIHNEEYVLDCLDHAGFSIIEKQEQILRYEVLLPVTSILIVARKT